MITVPRVMITATRVPLEAAMAAATMIVIMRPTSSHFSICPRRSAGTSGAPPAPECPNTQVGPQGRARAVSGPEAQAGCARSVYGPAGSHSCLIEPPRVSSTQSVDPEAFRPPPLGGTPSGVGLDHTRPDRSPPVPDKVLDKRPEDLTAVAIDQPRDVPQGSAAPGRGRISGGTDPSPDKQITQAGIFAVGRDQIIVLQFAAFLHKGTKVTLDPSGNLYRRRREGCNEGDHVFTRGRLLLVQEAPELSPEEGSGIPSLPQGREQGSHGRYKVLPPGADPVEPQQLGLHQSRVGVSGVEAGFVEEGMGIRLFKKHLNVQMVSGGEIRTLEGGSVQEVH
ncbi:uncharacterized protein LOC133635742 [Entelurus aequoreus]|uniref:uncharacterized protein LOC133635738 n=1 Tax=Entelurus aequoreus TaxID=161455 RepID=UPI002B1D9ADF|nr:uncharacterized protein LOC133635738 [Entelurus aequoreus]XP_061884974.1 uncharacterized protein LOC133635739 [Entelurus aequoreus]XP_061884975.1 uncharacterized protein LOC133635740 [Entelurus aequoreus]XP_061884976.1 uncharacterized protein LOC133635741 [Entelurus aequoreus]XP_061884977.1 uncharacterized protein LOC133635742 [Entelurus aequoreus]